MEPIFSFNMCPLWSALRPELVLFEGIALHGPYPPPEAFVPEAFVPEAFVKESGHMWKLLILVICSPVLFAQRAEDAVRLAETNFGAALTRGDTAALDRLLSPDLFYGHASGKSDDKRRYIARIHTGAQKYVAFEYDSATPLVHIYGRTATLITAARVKSVTDGQPNELHMRFLHVWIDSPSGWQLAAHQSVKLPE